MPRPQTGGCTAALSVLLVIIRNKKGLLPLRYSAFALRAQPGSGSEEAPGGAVSLSAPQDDRHRAGTTARRKPSEAGHSGPHIDAGATSNQAPAHPHTDDHRLRPQRRSPRAASGSEESDTAARSRRRRRRMPAQDQSRGRQKRTHQKQIHAGIIAQPAAQQRPHHAAATRRVRRAARHGSIPRTLRAALSVPHAGAVRTTAPRVPRPAPHGSFLTRSAPPYQSSVPPGTWPSRSERTGAPMPQPGLVLSAGRRARKNPKRRTHASGRRPLP